MSGVVPRERCYTVPSARVSRQFPTDGQRNSEAGWLKVKNLAVWSIKVDGLVADGFVVRHQPLIPLHPLP